MSIQMYVELKLDSAVFTLLLNDELIGNLNIKEWCILKIDLKMLSYSDSRHDLTFTKKLFFCVNMKDLRL